MTGPPIIRAPIQPIAPVQCTVPTDHPSLPGHFPGQPVVPGIVILNLVFETLNEQVQPLRVRGIRRLKFLCRLRPGQTFRIEASAPQAGRLAFKCLVQDELLAEGQVTVG